MGQQQLLLIVLVVIIVGIATIIATNVMFTNIESTNKSAVRQDMLSAIAQAQAVYKKPQALGGLGRDFTGLDIRELGIVSNQPTLDSETQVTNDNGVYTLSSNSGNTFTLTGTPSSGADDLVLVITWNETNQAWDFIWSEESES